MFKAQTVDSILSQFTKAVTDLEALKAGLTAKNDVSRQKRILLEAEEEANDLEIARAAAAAEKIKAFTI